MQRERIIVGLSGGVDSAVAAARLVRQGYLVEGVYLKYASETARGLVDDRQCSWRDDLASVEAVGRHLGIPVRSLNVEPAYDTHVISPLLDDIRVGRTPNPDVECNRFVKFRALLDWADQRGARYIATGHYARIIRRQDRATLHVGLDAEKDQSYFLAGLNESILQRTLFPIGRSRKREVRTQARRLGLPNADRPDSQGMCFLGPVRFREFLRQRLALQPGPIVESDGRCIGRHPGFELFTVGQRHGLGLGGGRPYYVAEKRLSDRTLVVAAGHDHPALFRHRLRASHVSWINGPPPTPRVAVEARIRYRQPWSRAMVWLRPDRMLDVDFQTPQWAITPGQSIVVGQRGRILGMATIDAVGDV